MGMDGLLHCSINKQTIEILVGVCGTAEVVMTWLIGGISGSLSSRM